MKLNVFLAIAMMVAVPASMSAQQTEDRTHLHSPETRAGLLSKDVVAHMIEQHGYSAVANLRLDGSVYRAEAQKNGANVNLEVDALSGRILNK